MDTSASTMSAGAVGGAEEGDNVVLPPPLSTPACPTLASVLPVADPPAVAHRGEDMSRVYTAQEAAYRAQDVANRAQETAEGHGRVL